MAKKVIFLRPSHFYNVTVDCYIKNDFDHESLNVLLVNYIDKNFWRQFLIMFQIHEILSSSFIHFKAKTLTLLTQNCFVHLWKYKWKHNLLFTTLKNYCLSLKANYNKVHFLPQCTHFLISGKVLLLVCLLAWINKTQEHNFLSAPQHVFNSGFWFMDAG